MLHQMLDIKQIMHYGFIDLLAKNFQKSRNFYEGKSDLFAFHQMFGKREKATLQNTGPLFSQFTGTART
jgi:hypothetical protein